MVHGQDNLCKFLIISHRKFLVKSGNKFLKKLGLVSKKKFFKLGDSEEEVHINLIFSELDIDQNPALKITA